MKLSKVLDGLMARVFLLAATVSTVSVILMVLFIFQQGLPLFQKVGVGQFLFGTRWAPTDAADPAYGILSFIVGSLFVTGVALAIAVPIGVACGVFLVEMSREPLTSILRSVVELLAGIPSVIYGLFGIAFVSRFVRETFGGNGYSVLSAAIILAVMTLPTIISITESSLRAVPRELREGALGVGATHWQTIAGVLIPSARSGILAGVVLGMGRAVGETMAVLLVAGNAPIMPTGLLSMVRTLTMNIITDMSYASGVHMTALFTTGVVLFVFILILNLTVQLLIKRSLEGSPA